jgi:flagellar biosynthesis protein FliQ
MGEEEYDETTVSAADDSVTGAAKAATNASVSDAIIEIPPYKIKYLQDLEEKLDEVLAFYFWKKYIASAFWANISLPINLSITLLTAITTAQTSTADFIPERIYKPLTIIALILSVLNTFFRPYAQMTANAEIVKAWSNFGTDYEEIYYTMDKYTSNFQKTIDAYRKLQKRMNEQRDKEGPTTANYLTDLIHVIATCTCLRKARWLKLKMNQDPNASTSRTSKTLAPIVIVAQPAAAGTGL